MRVHGCEACDVLFAVVVAIRNALLLLLLLLLHGFAVGTAFDVSTVAYHDHLNDQWMCVGLGQTHVVVIDR